MTPENWLKLGDSINNAFYFVIDIIIKIQGTFIDRAMDFGKAVLLIAILSAALNYALTGQGLKENIIKILKATLFFIIVIAAYPRIVGTITSWTFDLAQNSVGKNVENYFGNKTRQVERTINIYEYEDKTISNPYAGRGGSDSSYVKRVLTSKELTGTITQNYDNIQLFSNLSTTRTTSTGKGNIKYTAFAPAALLKIILLIAGDCITFADEKERFQLLPEFSRVLKGLICAFFLIMTGCFALLEYIVCFLEFMLVASVGVILFPFSIWEGSKFMAEKYIGAMVGFFMKLLFCNLAIFLTLYGFISLFYILQTQSFTATPDQLLFIIFTCLLFFFICKAAPGVAQSLLTGTPSLSAAGAISAVGGAVAAAGATMGLAKNAGNAAGSAVVGGVFGLTNTAIKAGSALKAAQDANKTGGQQFGAVMRSIGSDAAGSIGSRFSGLTRSLLGAKGNDPNTDIGRFRNSGGDFKQHLQDMKAEGNRRG